MATYYQESACPRREDAREQELRVVLLGKTGSGKSSLGNTLLGKEEFPIMRGMCSGTDKCQHASAERFGLQVQVTDTPGVCDTHRSEADVLKEVGKSLAVAVPGPHVVLMVLRCDRRFTKEEQDAYLTLKRLFGEEIRNFMIVVFVGSDSLGKSQEEREANLRVTIESGPESLRLVLQDAGGRYCGVDNTAPREDRDQTAQEVFGQIQNLISTNEGRHLSSDLLRKVEEEVQKVITDRMQEMGIPYQEACQGTKRDIVDEKISSNFFTRLLDIVGNTILPIIKVAFRETVALGRMAVATYCSMM